MLSLLLMRHAKSSWDEPGLVDQERQLNARGQRDARFMGDYLVTKKLAPKIILCSSAKRAQQTATLLIESFDSEPDLLFYNELYQSSPNTYLELLSGLPLGTESPVLILGHNPEMDDAFYQLARKNKHFSTGSIAHLRFSAKNWADVGKRPEAKLAGFWRPKDFA